LISAALFSLGILGVLTRKNAVNVLMGIELILNSANINLVAFSGIAREESTDRCSQSLVIVVAAAELAVAL
jgi:NADH-quinone oxidoreductase subunit K